jgi:hypothetical protein
VEEEDILQIEFIAQSLLVVKPTLDQKALLAQDQVIHLQDVYKTPEAFSNTYR